MKAEEKDGARKAAGRVLAWIRTDTANSDIAPGAFQREDLLTQSILDRTAEAIRQAEDAAYERGLEEWRDACMSQARILAGVNNIPETQKELMKTRVHQCELLAQMAAVTLDKARYNRALKTEPGK